METKNTHQTRTTYHRAMVFITATAGILGLSGCNNIPKQYQDAAKQAVSTGQLVCATTQQMIDAGVLEVDIATAKTITQSCAGLNIVGATINASTQRTEP